MARTRSLCAMSGSPPSGARPESERETRRQRGGLAQVDVEQPYWGIARQVFQVLVDQQQVAVVLPRCRGVERPGALLLADLDATGEFTPDPVLNSQKAIEQRPVERLVELHDERLPRAERGLPQRPLLRQRPFP